MTASFPDDQLTPGEQALWLLQYTAPDKGIANVAFSVAVSTPLRWWPLQAAFAWLLARHPALRTRYFHHEGGLRRAVVPAEELDPTIDILDPAADFLDPEAATPEQCLRDYAGRSFDLGSAPLVRLGWLRQSPEREYFCLVAHHIVVDAASLRVLLAELRACLQSFSETGEPPDLPAPTPSSRVEPSPESLRYWQSELAGIDPNRSALDLDRERPARATFAAEEIVHSFPASLTPAVRDLGARSHGTDAAVVCAAYLLALRSMGMADDAVVGVMASTRGTARAESVGYHVATLPLRVRIDGQRPFATLAATVAKRLMNGLEHSDVPFELLMPELVGDREDTMWWRNGLFRHLYNYRIAPQDKRPNGSANSWEIRDVHTGFGRFDVELTVELVGDTLTARVVYSLEVHDARFATELLERIETILTQAHACADAPVASLDPRTRAEKELLATVNHTDVVWPGPATVPGAVARAARSRPNETAVTDSARSITYHQLLALSDQVRGRLVAAGVQPGDVVALASPRGVRLAAAALGAWAAGAAYLPLDPEHPGHRLCEQLTDADARLILDGQLLPEDSRAGLVSLPVPEAVQADVTPGEFTEPLPDSTAYLIYTSGSTGRPKGVRISHRNLTNVVRHFTAELAAGPDSSMVWLTTFAFDISALELWLPLTCGGRVVTAPDEARSSPGRLGELVSAERIDIIQATPTTWQLVLGGDAAWLAGRTVLCGGEAMPAALAHSFGTTGARVLNVYGPTETTIWSTAADVRDEEPGQITVGRPIANTRVHLLDRNGFPLPVGVTGELCVAGDGVAQGYQNRPELTAERFRMDPRLGRYYRTGDLARLRRDGKLEILGRADRQVKLNGHRIELAEVEHILESHDEVARAVVLLIGESGPKQHLAGFITAEERPGLVEDLWEYARLLLPRYSVPSQLMVLTGFPETANGKVDFTALSKLRPSTTQSEAASKPRSAPDSNPDPLVEQLAKAWSLALAIPGLNSSSNFFVYGGSSLMAAMMAAEINVWSDVVVTLEMIFASPTPAALAARIRSDRIANHS